MKELGCVCVGGGGGRGGGAGSPYSIYLFYAKLLFNENRVDQDQTPRWAVSSGSVMFAKAFYYRLWQWKSYWGGGEGAGSPYSIYLFYANYCLMKTE